MHLKHSSDIRKQSSTRYKSKLKVKYLFRNKSTWSKCDLSLGSLIPDIHLFNKGSKHFSILRLVHMNSHFYLRSLTILFIFHSPWDKVQNPRHAIQRPTKFQPWLPFCVIPPFHHCAPNISAIKICAVAWMFLGFSCYHASSPHLSAWDSSSLSFHCLFLCTSFHTTLLLITTSQFQLKNFFSSFKAQLKVHLCKAFSITSPSPLIYIKIFILLIIIT